MRVDGERWPSNGIRRPGLHAFAVGTVWEESRVCQWAKQKFAYELFTETGHMSWMWGPFF